MPGRSVCASGQFWNGEQPLAVLSYYASRLPQSYYGEGGRNLQFVGLARNARDAEVRECCMSILQVPEEMLPLENIMMEVKIIAPLKRTFTRRDGSRVACHNSNSNHRGRMSLGGQKSSAASSGGFKRIRINQRPQR
ncbi:MAG: hypothetical protein R3C11_07195 [Planctomycetaceae bacterium]